MIWYFNKRATTWLSIFGVMSEPCLFNLSTKLSLLDNYRFRWRDYKSPMGKHISQFLESTEYMLTIIFHVQRFRIRSLRFWRWRSCVRSPPRPDKYNKYWVFWLNRKFFKDRDIIQRYIQLYLAQQQGPGVLIIFLIYRKILKSIKDGTDR